MYMHGNGFIASPANTVRGIANDPNQNGGYPEFLASVVGANGGVVSPGPAELTSPRVFRSGDRGHRVRLCHCRQDGRRPRDYETNTETKNYTYTGSGGVAVGNWLARSVFAAKFAERNFLFSNVIGSNSKDPVQSGPRRAGRGRRPWLTTDTTVYPAIVNKRMVWIVDGYKHWTIARTPELTSLSSATADSNGGRQSAAPGQAVSYIRNSVKATVDAYDGTVTLYAQDDKDPVLCGVDEGVPGHRQTEVGHLRGSCCAPPVSGGSVQGAANAAGQIPRRRPGDVLLDVGLLGRPAGPQPTASSFQPPYYIVAKDLARNDNSSSFQLTSAMNRFRRDFLAAYISASSDPETYGKITVLTIPGQVNGPKLAFQRDQYRHRGQSGPRRDRT